MFETRPSAPYDVARIIEIWRKAVDATHHFLTPQDRASIEDEIVAFFPQLQFTLAVDNGGKPLAFMLVQDGHMEALFVDPAHKGKGIGRTLVHAALRMHPSLTTDVNEQNASAILFYERMGFQPIGRSPLDGQGRPYPLIHLAFHGLE